MHLVQATLPYSLELSLLRLENRRRQVVDRVEPGSSYVRALDLDGRIGLVRLRAVGSSEGVASGGLCVEVEGQLDATAVLPLVRQAFALDLDQAGFLRHMDHADPVLAALARRFEGARPIRPFSLWESLAWAIIGQQVNVSFALTMKEALVRLGGRTYGGYPAFPGAATVASLRYEDLQAEKFTRKKAEFVIDLARAIADGSLDLAALVALPFDEALAGLVKLRGIGRWTAECLLMDAGFPDALPADDIGVRNAVWRYYGLADRPTGAEVRAIGEGWAPWRSLATYYLWLGLTSE